MKEFAKSQRIPYQTLLWYKKRLQKSSEKPHHDLFTPIVPAVSGSGNEKGIEVEFKKLTVCINDSISKESLAGLIKIFEERND